MPCDRRHSPAVADQPRARSRNIRRWRPSERSRTTAKSGTSSRYQNSTLTRKYVAMATASQMSGELKLIQSPRSFGYGISQYALHARPRCSTGKMTAVMSATIVIVSAARAIAVRHVARKRNRMAEMKVPECAMPIQNTNEAM